MDFEKVREVVRRALDEDLGSGDVTTQTTVSPKMVGKAEVLARESGVVAGVPVAQTTFQTISKGLRVKTLRQDGQRVKEGDVILQLNGPAQAILSAERVALNFLQRLSGIATQTARFVEAVAGTGAKILDTRKTTPGLRFLEKYAVRVGGGHNHRMGLDDMVLIKDNHIKAAGGIPQAVRKARAQGLRLALEAEAGDLEQVVQALEAGVDRIMLDNMSLAQMKEAVALVQGRKEMKRRPELEASGRINLKNIRRVAMTGVDFISIGAITHSAPALDMSLVLTTLSPLGGREKR